MAIATGTQSETSDVPLRKVLFGPRVARFAYWGVVSIFIVLILASYALPVFFQLHGDKLLVVTSGSMEPEITAGDAVVVQPVQDPSELRVGQVVTFWSPVVNSLVTHRIVALQQVTRRDPATDQDLRDSSGQKLQDAYIETRGDANNGQPDPDLTPAALVQGIVREVHPEWGRLLTWSQSPMGRLLLFGPPLLLLVVTEMLSRVPEHGWRRYVGDRRGPREHTGPLSRPGRGDYARR